MFFRKYLCMYTALNEIISKMNYNLYFNQILFKVEKHFTQASNYDFKINMFQKISYFYSLISMAFINLNIYIDMFHSICMYVVVINILLYNYSCSIIALEYKMSFNIFLF